MGILTYKHSLYIWINVYINICICVYICIYVLKTVYPYTHKLYIFLFLKYACTHIGIQYYFCVYPSVYIPIIYMAIYKYV